MKTATVVDQKDGPGVGQTQLLVRCEPPMEGNEYVVSSSVVSAFDTLGPETYLFPADADFKVTDYGELPGSQRGTTSHKVALADAGYELCYH